MKYFCLTFVAFALISFKCKGQTAEPAGKERKCIGSLKAKTDSVRYTIKATTFRRWVRKEGSFKQCQDCRLTGSDVELFAIHDFSLTYITRIDTVKCRRKQKKDNCNDCVKATRQLRYEWMHKNNLHSFKRVRRARDLGNRWDFKARGSFLGRKVKEIYLLPDSLGKNKNFKVLALSPAFPFFPRGIIVVAEQTSGKIADWTPIVAELKTHGEYFPSGAKLRVMGWGSIKSHHRDIH
jgi:hypothetical protein